MVWNSAFIFGPRGMCLPCLPSVGASLVSLTLAHKNEENRNRNRKGKGAQSGT